MMNTTQDFAIPATCAMDDDDGDGWGDFEAPHGGMFFLMPYCLTKPILLWYERPVSIGPLVWF